MLGNIITTGEQVAVLLVLLMVGFVCGRIGMFNDESINHLSTFALKVVGPCAIMQSFRRPFDTEMFHSMMAVVALSVICHVLFILSANAFLHDPEPKTQRVKRYSVIFANCGYMGLPLQQILFGADGVFYGASWIIVHQILTWTYGLVVMSGDKREVSVRKIFTTPGILANITGMLIFLFSISLPSIIGSPIELFSHLNVPIPMVISGYFLARADLKSIWKHADYYLTIAMRLVLLPLLCIGLMYLAQRFFPLDSTMLVSCIVNAATPIAAAATMFGTLYRQDSKTAANLVSISTILSVLTLPVMVAIAQSAFS